MPAKNFGAGILADASIVEDGYWCAHSISAPLPEAEKRTQAIPMVPTL
jgi:hypothetical protein